MPKFFVALAVFVVTIAPAAMAQRGGTDSEQAACTRDVSRYCRKVIDQGDFTVLACLKENRAKLSGPCKQVLINHNQ